MPFDLRTLLEPVNRLVALLALAVPAGGLAQDADPPGIEWLRDLDEARRAATASRKPMLVAFRCET